MVHCPHTVHRPLGALLIWFTSLLLLSVTVCYCLLPQVSDPTPSTHARWWAYTGHAGGEKLGCGTI